MRTKTNVQRLFLRTCQCRKQKKCESGRGRGGWEGDETTVGAALVDSGRADVLCGVTQVMIDVGCGEAAGEVWQDQRPP